eukprot:472507_1
MGDTFSLSSNTNSAEDVLTSKKIESSCPTAFKAQIQAKFKKAKKDSQVHIIWTALVKRALKDSSAENLYFIGQMHKARKKAGDDLRAFIETVYNEVNIDTDTRNSFLPGATAKPQHWPSIIDEETLNKSPFKTAESKVIQMLSIQTLSRLFRDPPAGVKKYVANE